LQATGLPARNNSTQYTPIVAESGEVEKLRSAPEYSEFFKRVRGDVATCLLQNSVIDILADDFEMMGDDEGLKGHKSGKPINEVMSFVDIRHCKDMQVSSLRWHPQHQRRQGVCLPFGAHSSLPHV
jgi:hypothetical protein